MSEVNLEKYSEAEWEHFRTRFYDSALNDTEMAILGQNAGTSWPFKGAGETPEKYIAYDFDELQEVPGLIGKKSRIRILMDILRETLAFDEPFSELVDKVEADSYDDDTFERILAKMEIPHDYPATFVHLDEESVEMLQGHDINTLIDVVHFSQKIATDVTVGADLKSFLNGLANKDEIGVAKHIPYRPGMRGLHLAEAIALIADDLPESTRVHLQTKSDAALTAENESILANSNEADIEASLVSAVERIAEVCEWFSEGAVELKSAFNGDSAPERYFIMIKDPVRERMALELSKLHLGIRDSDSEKSSGIFGKLFGR